MTDDERTATTIVIGHRDRAPFGLRDIDFGGEPVERPKPPRLEIPSTLTTRVGRERSRFRPPPWVRSRR